MITVYKTQQGETWDQIAVKLYGSGKYTGALLQANLKYSRYVFLPYGTELAVPEVETASELPMPPWKKVEG